MLLTDISVRALKPTERQRTYFDAALRGFGVRVSPGGTKTFVLTRITDKLADTPSEQAHALAVARTFPRWCARPPRRYIPHSPLEGLQLKTGKPRKRVLDDRELIQVWRAAEAQGHPHGTTIQLLILTGQRRGEIAGLQQAWINAEERTITLPSRLTKNSAEHLFPYGQMAAELFEELLKLDTDRLERS
jgi:integrase